MSLETPLASFHKQVGGEMADYCGWEMPKVYTDVETEAKGLDESCVAFDLCCFGKINLKGSGAGDLVAALLGNSANAPEDKKCVSGTCVDENGNTVDIIRVARQGDSYLLLTTPARKDSVLEFIEKTKNEKSLQGVTVNDQTEKTANIAVYGPKAIEALNNILPLDINSIEPDEVKGYSIFMMSITVIRGSWLGCDGMELICPAAAAKFAGGAIEKYHKQESIVPAGMECLAKKFKETHNGFDIFQK